jgi:ribosomal protein S24E
MNLKIVSQEEKPLLSRTKVLAHISFDAVTPSNDEVKKQLATALKKDEKLIVVKKIATGYGYKEADVDAVVYESVEAKEKIEVKTKAMKDAEKKAAEAAAAPKEEAKPEEKKEEAAPAEEKKEEPKAEEKPAEAPAEEKKEEEKKE